MNKNLMIGLGVLAVAGIGLYMWKRRKDGESSSSDEAKSNAVGVRGVNVVNPRFSPYRKGSNSEVGSVLTSNVVYKSAPMPVGGDCFYKCEKLSCPSCSSGFYCKCPETSTL